MKMTGEGWMGLGPNRGRWVPAEQGFEVACRACGVTHWNPEAPEAALFARVLVEWYFSGDWIWKEAMVE